MIGNDRNQCWLIIACFIPFLPAFKKKKITQVYLFLYFTLCILLLSSCRKGQKLIYWYLKSY